MNTEPNEEDVDADSDFDEGLSLEELSQSYANVLGHTASRNEALETSDSAEEVPEEEAENSETPEDNDESDAHCPVTPLSILESILFVGRPDNGAITAAEVASLMRGVQESEIGELVTQLNTTYEEQGRALRVAETPDGYRAVLADDLNFMRDQFYGRVREIKLNQAAIDCLALVAYQPGISRKQLEEQRGQPSGGVLNQLVRRELLEIRREGEGKQLSAHYYPTDKLTQLAGLTSLDDLPQVEEFE